MNRLEAWFVHVSTLLVGGTGAVYAWMRYFLEPVDEFAVVNHPLQPATQALHLWLAPLLVFALGLIWREHVWGHLSRGVRRRRASGLSLLALFAPMVVSGYLIQTAAGDPWRAIWIGVHLASSGLFVFGYVGHQLSPYLRRRRSAVRVPGARPAVSGDASS